MDGPLVRLPLLPTGVDWTVCVRDAATGEVLAAQSPERVLRTASIGKIFLLCEAARRFESGEMDPGGPVSWLDEELVADSGLWHRLSLRSLPAVDACSLIGAVSDNLATNVFVRVLGIDSIRAMARALGCEDSALLDRVRDSRGPSDPPTLSVGRADELSSVMVQLHRCAAGAAGAVSPAVAARVLAWLGANTDLSMVSSAFCLDPLGHDEFDRDLWLVNKTGTVSTARVDVGLVRHVDGRAVAWAVGANWDADTDPRDEVLASMAGIGRAIRSEFASSAHFQEFPHS